MAMDKAYRQILDALARLEAKIDALTAPQAPSAGEEPPAPAVPARGKRPAESSQPTG
jgi:hypothetical protein